jgi:hypothetical protein
MFWPWPTDVIEKDASAVLALIEKNAFATDGTFGVWIQVRLRIVKDCFGHNLRRDDSNPISATVSTVTTAIGVDWDRLSVNLAEGNLFTTSVTCCHRGSSYHLILTVVFCIFNQGGSK